MRLLFVTVVPFMPLIGYLFSGAPSFAFHEEASEPHLNPHPRYDVGLPVAPPTRGVRRRGASPFTWRAIRERAGKWELKRMEVPRWRLMKTDNFAIRSDALLRELRYAGVYLEEGLKVLKRILGGKAEDIRFSIRIFRWVDAFRVYASCVGVPEADSFYNPRTFEVVVYRGKEDNRSRFSQALLHELVHIYMHCVFGITEPLWLAEGLAEYFSRHDTSTGRLRVGLVDKETVALLKKSWKEGNWVPESALVALPRAEFYGERRDLAYPQSWLLVHFLMNYGEDVHDDMIRGCLEGASLDDLMDLERLEKEVKPFLEDLN